MKTIALLCTMALAVAASAGPVRPPADALLEKYFVIQKGLASDSLNAVAASAADIVKISREAAAKEPKAKAQLLAVSAAASKLNAADMKSARNGFGELSGSLIDYLKASGANRNPPYQWYCPMMKKSWLQPDKAVRNPYYGSSMPKCGELVP